MKNLKNLDKIYYSGTEQQILKVLNFNLNFINTDINNFNMYY
jgi:hypothetical protein